MQGRGDIGLPDVQSPRELAAASTDAVLAAVANYFTRTGPQGMFPPRGSLREIGDAYRDWMNSYCDWHEECDDEEAIYHFLTDWKRLEEVYKFQRVDGGQARDAWERVMDVMGDAIDRVFDRGVQLWHLDVRDRRGFGVITLTDIKLVNGKIEAS